MIFPSLYYIIDLQDKVIRMWVHFLAPLLHEVIFKQISSVGWPRECCLFCWYTLSAFEPGKNLRFIIFNLSTGSQILSFQWESNSLFSNYGLHFDDCGTNKTFKRQFLSISFLYIEKGEKTFIISGNLITIEVFQKLEICWDLYRCLYFNNEYNCLVSSVIFWILK